MAKAVKQPVFEDILDTPASEVQRPKPAPQGTYLVMAKGHGRRDVAKTGTPYSEYTLQVISATEDVDENDLKSWLTKASGEVTLIRERYFKLTFYNTHDALWRHKRFLLDLGIPDVDDDDNVRTVNEMSQDVPGRQCYAHIKHSPSSDGETMYANVDKTAPVKE